MKYVTRILIALIVLAMLASCTPNGATSPTEPPAAADGSPPSTAPTHTPTAPPEGTASDEAGTSTSAAPDPTSEPTPDTSSQAYLNRINNMLDRWLLDDPTRSPLDSSTFFFLEGDAFSAGVPGQGAMFLATDEADTHHIILAENDGRGNYPSLEQLAFTDENGEWRSGENGSGVDAETASDIIDTIARTDDSDSEYGTYHIPIHGMEFLPETGVVLALSGYETFLVYIEAQDSPDRLTFDPPIQLFYEYELIGFTSGEPHGFSIGLLAYNEGYGWSKLEG